jgi:sigma-E factor negative regulatory protein RseA
MKEKLSAIIDGELEGDVYEHLGRLRADPELRAAWDTYHLIGDSLRGHPSPEIASRVISRLRDEPTVLAPPRARGAAKRIGWYGMYAAASMAAVAVVAWTAFPDWHSGPQLAGNTAATSVATSSEIPAENLVVSLPSADVENYLLAHQPYSHVSAMQGVAPYVRSVAEERRASAQ